MSRKKNWYQYDDEGEDFDEKKQRVDRKKQRRLDRALKIKDVRAYIDEEDNENANIYFPKR
jgi:hypothetical protein